ncbi:MAG TPA: DNA polymerase III subunit beta [Streptosporangiaceae bacterium]|nr:DNA polymerase III subunit beta [Streptosporangiaceae bacterium]
MRLRIGREALADAVAWAARALPTRPVIPILAGLLLEAGEGGLTLSCFDYDVSARVGAEAAVAEPGRALVSGRLLAEIARSLPARPVDLVSEGDTVVLTCGSGRFTLLGLPADDFPALPALPPPAGTVDGGKFATAVSQVVIAAGRDDTLPMLTGVLIEIDGSEMTLVATDRYRMAVRELDWQPVKAGVRASALVPARTLADAAKTMVAGSEVAISLAAEGQQTAAVADDRSGLLGSAAAGGVDGANGLIGFDGGGRRLTTRLLGTEFVAYKSRFPRDYRSCARLAAGPFSAAIRRVALVADRESRLLLTFRAGELVLETGSGDGSQAVETIEAAFEGEDGFAIAFKPQYLIDGVAAAAAGGDERAGGAEPAADADDHGGDEARASNVDGDKAQAERATGVILEFTAPDKPAIIRGSPGFRYLLAPMRT